MIKGKILGMKNTEDTLWYRFSPDDLTIENLQQIFDLYDPLLLNDKKRFSYKNKSFKELSFIQDSKDHKTYFIITKEAFHLILFKTLNWEKYSEVIHRKFVFQKFKDNISDNIKIDD